MYWLRYLLEVIALVLVARDRDYLVLNFRCWLAVVPELSVAELRLLLIYAQRFSYKLHIIINRTGPNVLDSCLLDLRLPLSFGLPLLLLPLTFLLQLLRCLGLLLRLLSALISIRVAATRDG